MGTTSATAAPTARPKRTVLLFSGKGGVGKTTIATSFAALNHLRGRPTVLVDLDPQGSAVAWGNGRPDGSPLAGLFVASFPNALTNDRFAELSRGCEVAVLDGPPRLGDIMLAAAAFADVVLVPLQPADFDLWSLGKTLDLLDNADAMRRQRKQPPIRRVLALNAANERTRIAQDVLAEVKRYGEVGPTIGDRVRFKRARDGQTVVVSQPDGPAANEIKALWRFVDREARRG